ncbi:MAG: sigma-70 family RNA polymerase sigma factor [Pirellulaceae bacterium]
MINERQLIDQALDGDPAAFGQLMRRYQDRLFTSIVHVVGQREEAEDIVQDAFLQALLKLNSFRRDSSFYTWLYRIALNLTANRHRRNRREVSMDPPPSGSLADPADPNELPVQHMLRHERGEQIQIALQALSEEYRTVLVLREIDGLDYQSIARVLEVSVGTVRSRLHRARALMRDRLRQRPSETLPRGEGGP